jgi:hypothetical protein
MSRLRRLLVLSVLLLGLAATVQALDSAAAPAPDNSSTSDLNKGRATIDPNG